MGKKISKHRELMTCGPFLLRETSLTKLKIGRNDPFERHFVVHPVPHRSNQEEHLDPQYPRNERLLQCPCIAVKQFGR